MDETSITAEPMKQIVDRLGVDAVFGQPIKQDGATVIPVAEIGVGFRRGMGLRRLMGTRGGADATAGGGAERAMGSGGMGRASPRGFIQITRDGVAFKPIINRGRIVLAAIALVAWNVFWVSRTVRVLGGHALTRRRFRALLRGR